MKELMPQSYHLIRCSFRCFSGRMTLLFPMTGLTFRELGGTQLISKEQRLMFLDGGDYAILRDAIPEITLWSPRKVALRTSRKIEKTVHSQALWYRNSPQWTTPGLQEGLIHTPGEPAPFPSSRPCNCRINSMPIFKATHVKLDQTLGIDSWVTDWTRHLRFEGIQKPRNSRVS